MRVVSIDTRASSSNGLASVVDAIGSDEFSARWVGLVRETCDAAFISAFRITNGRATVVVSDGLDHPEIAQDHSHRYAEGMHWRDDPALAAGARCGTNFATLVQVDTAQISNGVLKREFYGPARVCDKLAIRAPRENALFVVSLLRTLESGHFTETIVERVAGQAAILVGLLAKHAALTHNTATDSLLASVSIIEQRLARAEVHAMASWRLTNRERQVCARILFGITAAGIAIDLGINEYSVDTYRKRAYLRLGVATRHELLRWYLSLDGALMSQADSRP